MVFLRAMKICVIGTGYVGLVAGAGFSDMGNDVVCCDVDRAKIDGLNKGELPIYEPGLDKLVETNAAEKRLTFTTDIPKGVAGADVVLLAVGTPPGPDGSADLSYIFKAAESVADALTGWAVIVTKSTVPIGTGDKIEALMKARTKHEFAVASNPEFLKEGDAVNDFMKPDRVIVGAEDKRAIDCLRGLYAPFTRTSDRMLVMDRRSAELTKYAANSMLATRISFMNDLANLCEILGADIELVRKGMGSDARIGPKFLYAGPGFGGSCFPKDLRACITTGREVGYYLKILDAVVAVNEKQKRLTFTTDIPKGVAGAEVVGTDPVAMSAVKKQIGDKIRYEESNYTAAEGADALVLVTEWNEFRRPSFDRLKATMRQPVIFDGRNIWNPAELRAAGFTYSAIGRGK